MQTEAIEVPPQPEGERRKLGAMWAVLALASVVVVIADAPYDLSEQSTIMVKTETLINIKSAREMKGGTSKDWPVNESDKRFGFGSRALRERTRPTFQFSGLTRDRHDPRIEIAHYEMVVRDRRESLQIRYNPFEKPKKRLF